MRGARAGALALLLALLPARARHRTYEDRPPSERPFFLPALESSDEAVNYARGDRLSEAMFATLGKLLGRMQRDRSLDRRLLARFGRARSPAAGTRCRSATTRSSRARRGALTRRRALLRDLIDAARSPSATASRGASRRTTGSARAALRLEPARASSACLSGARARPVYYDGHATVRRTTLPPPPLL